MAGSSVVNICFHGIGAPTRELEPGEEPYWVSKDTYLRVLDEVATWPSSTISFDDGNVSDVEHGLPGLVERGLTATFFPVADRIDTPGFLSADEVQGLVAQGMGIGNHGMDHRTWRRMDTPTAHRQLAEARAVISQCAGTTVDTAACPCGAYDRRCLAHLRRLGYRHVFTSDRRPAEAGSWLQARYSVRSHDTPTSLRAEVFSRNPVRRVRQAAAGLFKAWR